MKREKFSPAVGDEYINQGNGSSFRCVECLDEPGTAILQNTESGWTFKAHGLGMYSNGFVDWDFSTGGRFA